MSKDTDMTMQERLREISKLNNNPWFAGVADHIDQLKADKAELVEALRHMRTSMIRCSDEWEHHEADTEAKALIAKHKAKP